MFPQWWGGPGVMVSKPPGQHAVEGRLFSKRKVTGWTSAGVYHRRPLPQDLLNSSAPRETA